MKKIKRSTGVALAFLIYVSVTAAYLLPRNTEVSQTEKYLTVAGSYVIVLLLWLVLRKKEQMRERRKNDDAKFGTGAQAGTFLADGFALMVNAGADWSQPVDIYTLGTGARCYFNTTGVYIGGGLDWERRRYKGGGHNNDWGLGIEAGYAYFLSRTVTIEPAVYYKWRFDVESYCAIFAAKHLSTLHF